MMPIYLTLLIQEHALNYIKEVLRIHYRLTRDKNAAELANNLTTELNKLKDTNYEQL